MKRKWLSVTFFMTTIFLIKANDEASKLCVKSCRRLTTPSAKIVQDERCGTSGSETKSEYEIECDRHCGEIFRGRCNVTGSCLFENSLEAPSSPSLRVSEFTSISLEWNNTEKASEQTALYVLQLETNLTSSHPLEILPFVPHYFLVRVFHKTRTTNFTIDKLQPETLYRFRVAAIGLQGTSLYSPWSEWYATRDVCDRTSGYVLLQTGFFFHKKKVNVTFPCSASEIRLNVSLKVVHKVAVVLDGLLSWKFSALDLDRPLLIRATVRLLQDSANNDLCNEYHEKDFLLRSFEISNRTERYFSRPLSSSSEPKQSIHFGCRYSFQLEAVSASTPNSFQTSAEFRVPECLDGVRSCPIRDNSDQHTQGDASSAHIHPKISEDGNGKYTTNVSWSLDAWKGLPEVEYFHAYVQQWPRVSNGFHFGTDVFTTQGESLYHISSYNMSEGKSYRAVVVAYHGKNCLHDNVERQTFKISRPCPGGCNENATCFPKDTFDGSASCRCVRGYTGNGTVCTVIEKTETPQASQKNEHDVNVAAIVIPVLLIVVILLFIGLFLWRRMQKRKEMAHELFVGMQNDLPTSPSNTNIYQHYPSTQERPMDNDYPVKNSESLEEREANVIYVPQEIQDAIAKGLTDGYEFNADLLKLGVRLGKGAFGNVYCAEAYGVGTDPGWIQVAVKTLSDTASEKGVDDFIEEIELMKKLGEHENVITMLGCCTLSSPICLILEYAPYGNLLNYLRTLRNQLEGNITTKDFSVDDEHKDQLLHGQQEHKKDGDTKDAANPSMKEKSEDFPAKEESVDGLHYINDIIESNELESFALQIAKGMTYVAGRGIVHRDLAARNILIGHNRTLKISDFGLSREGVYVKTTSGKIPLRWLSVEAIRERLYSSASDVWAFGIVLWEICTLGGFPYPTISDRDLLKFLVNGKRLEKPNNCSDDIYAIMLDCWSAMPGDRPSFAQLRDLLWKLKNNENPYVNIDPLENYHFPPTDDVQGSLEDDSLPSLSSDDLSLSSPAMKDEYVPMGMGSKDKRTAQEGMKNPVFRTFSQSDDSDSKEELNGTLKDKQEDNVATSSC